MVKQSLLQPLLDEDCFTSRAEDRPLWYPLIQQLNKFKDMLIRMVKAIPVDNVDPTVNLINRVMTTQAISEP